MNAMFPDLKKAGFVRQSAALILTAGLTLTLAGCGIVGGPGACIPLEGPGEVSELVDSSGALGAEPTVSFPTPLIASERQTSTLVEGDGIRVLPDYIVDFHGSVYEGETGELIQTTGYDPSQLVRAIVVEGNVIGQGLQCQSVGSRVASIIPGAQGGTRVLVVDAVRAFPGKADGQPQLLGEGYPSVVSAPGGEHGITFTDAEAPTEPQHQALLLGNGPEVQEGDTVVMHYTGVYWGSDEVFVNSWRPPTGSPANVARGPAVDVVANADTLGPEFADALIGQPVGSQVIVVIPATNEQRARVIVFDVLGII